MRAACVRCHRDRFESSDVAAGANRREGNGDGEGDWGFQPVVIFPLISVYSSKGQKYSSEMHSMPRRQNSFNCCQVNEQPVQHLSAQHGNTKLVAKDLARRSSEGVDEQPTPPKQAKLFSSVGAQKKVTQKDINMTSP